MHPNSRGFNLPSIFRWISIVCVDTCNNNKLSSNEQTLVLLQLKQRYISKTVKIHIDLTLGLSRETNNCNIAEKGWSVEKHLSWKYGQITVTVSLFPDFDQDYWWWLLTAIWVAPTTIASLLQIFELDSLRTLANFEFIL